MQRRGRPVHGWQQNAPPPPCPRPGALVSPLVHWEVRLEAVLKSGMSSLEIPSKAPHLTRSHRASFKPKGNETCPRRPVLSDEVRFLVRSDNISKNFHNERKD